MFTIIGGDGKEYGPVTVEVVRQWLATGRANLETRAKKAGDDLWQPLGDFDEFSGRSTAQPPPLDEPVPTGPVEPKAYAASLVARAAPLDITGCVDRGWKVFKANFWPLVGVTLLVMLTSYVISWAAGHLPRPRYYLGTVKVFGPDNLASYLLGTVFSGGLNYYYLRKIRGLPTNAGEAFTGFTSFFLPLLLLGLVSSLLTAAGFILLLLPGIYLLVAYMFAQFLIVDKQMPFWCAMEVSRRVITAQWWRVFSLLLLCGLIVLLGLFGFIIGIFITMPIAFVSVACAYEDLCNPKPRQG
jgi:hypothetical protein